MVCGLGVRRGLPTTGLGQCGQCPQDVALFVLLLLGAAGVIFLVSGRTGCARVCARGAAGGRRWPGELGGSIRCGGRAPSAASVPQSASPSGRCAPSALQPAMPQLPLGRSNS